MRKRVFYLLVVVFVSAACGGNDLAGKIKDAEARLDAAISTPGKANDGRQEIGLELIDLYSQFVQANPSDTASANYLYRSAMISGDFHENYNRCVQFLERLRREYPDSYRGESALFLLGYTYADKLRDLPRAKAIYSSFLEKYPDSEMAGSVQFELDNLGKTLDQLPVIGSGTTGN